MKIVVLDGYTLNPGDLSWNELQKLGTVELYQRTPADQVYERAKGADILLANKTPLPADIINTLPLLKYIGVLATGFNVVDVEAAKRRGVVVTNLPGYGTHSVVQLTFALLLELCQHVQRHSDAAMEGKWSRSPDFCFWDFPLIELSDKTMGIIGFGTIGQQVADVASAFGMKITGFSRTQTDQSHCKNFSWASLDDILHNSDVISIHCPLTPQTKDLVNETFLKK